MEQRRDGSSRQKPRPSGHDVDGHLDKTGKNFDASVTGEAASRHAWDDEGHMTVCHSDHAGCIERR
jgi:hypothetical protein